MQYTTVTYENIEIIRGGHFCRFQKNEPWVKKGDSTMMELKFRS